MPDSSRGRVYGAFNTTNGLISLTSVGLAGVVGDILGIVPMLSVAGGITLLAGMLALVLLPKAEAHSDLAEETEQEASAAP